MTDANYLKPKSCLYYFFNYWPRLIVSYILFFFLGFYRIRYKTFKLKDFWADYAPVQKCKPSLIVCNHVSVFDMYLLLLIKENPSFLSKRGVKNVPVIGFFAKLSQTLFISRRTSEERARALELIKEKVALAESGKVKPMIIFPEGTTCNGRGLMAFKKGPFMYEKPVIVYSLYYGNAFSPCFNLISNSASLFILLSSFENKITFLRFDTAIDPHWILKKQGRTTGQEGNWEVIAKEVKDLMCFAFGFEQDEQTFQQKSEFECIAEGVCIDELFGKM